LKYDFLERLKTEILVSDGATGTELQARGLVIGDCTEEWNLARPDVVAAVHKDYYSAGADLVETNTLGANRVRLKTHNLEKRVQEINKKAVEIARGACPPGCYVAGSVGPTGEFLEPIGTATLDEMVEIFGEQVIGLVEGGADIIVVETMMAVDEASAAVTAAKKYSHLPVIATMTFEPGKAGFRTMMNVTPEQAVKTLADAGADVLGSNCGRGIDDMINIIREMRQYTSLPLLAQANAGLPQMVDGKAIYQETPEYIRPRVKQLLEAGANIIGGCCGTTPAHTKVVREEIDASERKRV
jgi:5-methyltetrahydrofolate--homocysteine methyltransferase